MPTNRCQQFCNTIADAIEANLPDSKRVADRIRDNAHHHVGAWQSVKYLWRVPDLKIYVRVHVDALGRQVKIECEFEPFSNKNASRLLAVLREVNMASFAIMHVIRGLHEISEGR